MPLFEVQSGEGVYVAPSPRRSGCGRIGPSKATKLRAYSLWWGYSRTGMSLRDVAEMVEKPVSTVANGLKAYRVYLASLIATRTPDMDGRVEPSFGDAAGGFTPAMQVPNGGDCARCRNFVRFDNIVCPYCHCVSDDRQRHLDAEEGRDIRKARATAENRAIAGPPPSDLTSIAERAMAADAAEQARHLSPSDARAIRRSNIARGVPAWVIDEFFAKAGIRTETPKPKPKAKPKKKDGRARPRAATARA